MLSALYSHTEAWPADVHQSTDSESDGSFDNTPAPSNRPSISIDRSILEIGPYYYLPHNANNTGPHHGRRLSALARISRGHGDAEKEPLILLRDITDQDTISLRGRATGYESKIIADGAGSGKENPYRSGGTQSKSGRKRLQIVSDTNTSHLQQFPTNNVFEVPLYEPAYEPPDLRDPLQVPDEKSCSVASFSTVGSHAGHHHLQMSPGKPDLASQPAKDGGHSLSACVAFPIDNGGGSDNLIAPIPTHHARPKLSLVDMAHSHSDNVTGSTPEASLSSKNVLKRSYSVGSLLDYARASKWLRDMLWYPESYTTKLTRRPTRSGLRSNSVNALENPSLAEIQLARRVTGLSKYSTRSDSRFDGFLFRRAVSDLERLVNEAVSTASQAVDLPQHQAHNSTSSIESSDEPAGSDSDVSSTSLSVLSEDADNYCSPRPPCKHANTFSATDDRPRLREVVENYSDDGVMSKSDEYSQAQRHVKFQLPETAMGEDGNQSFSVHSRMRGPTRTGGPRGGQKVYSNPYQATTDRVPQGGFQAGDEQLPERDLAGRQLPADHGISLRRRSHVSLRAGQRFNLARSHRRQPIARDWSTTRKRFVASVACISTALIGIILGIYAGLVPSIQYFVIDPSHVVVHGNTGCFLGMAIPTFLFWPLPLLHGRKPYILTGLVLAMPLLFPQALAVTSQRLVDSVEWRALLLASRTLMGVSLGFASMNFHSILTDLFGASLMSVNPHQEVVDHYDARRHGGGMGAWLGIWTWCWIGSLGVGFLVGAAIIDQHTPTWGFYVSIILIAVVLFLNVVCPEVRRSAYRRSVAEVRTGPEISRRVARGEIMMHRAKTGPRWWGEEVYHGIVLSMEMLRQPGFLVMAIYSSWIYCQVVLIIVLLGSLASKFYRFRSPAVGLLVASMSLGAFLAIPFQKANLFSRSRFAQLNTNKATLDKRVVWSSHLVRRTAFTLLLPLAGVCYAAVSTGPPMHVSLPTIFSLCVGFLSCLAISECNGLIMETFDCSDLSPGMTGRQRGSSARNPKRTNYSSFPRVTAGFALIHTFAFTLAAGSTALGGHVTRILGQQVATGVVAGILFVLTVLLLLVLVRFVEIQIIPRSKFDEMDRVVEARRKSTIRRASMPNDPQALMEEEQAWRPIMIGNPIGKTRRMSILELGSMTRWQEIRKKNRLIDAGAHLNRGALGHGLEALDDQMSDLRRNLHIGSGKKKGRRTHLSDESSETGNDPDFDGYSMSNLSTPGRTRHGGERDDPMETAMIDEELGRAHQK
ncbi:Major facilitator superfamily transporter [Cordyceps militaris]|uniref:Major facilitator superfamily transporter n=1 Tax=Cordyceps militaris TaxID=73501 RepID=A0A2H4SV33_CORMI|nr:Major facilitator superfamily transporter [Cordyceps militaris]